MGEVIYVDACMWVEFLDSGTHQFVLIHTHNSRLINFDFQCKHNIKP